ncbi:Ig-like domain-containing protein [Micromonospora sp. B9E7]|uniref:Ig-like domain-containing protein n=1 Tax=Micromonospora sp. B9E7 TaxID=3153574 RepID=UPI00325D177C
MAEERGDPGDEDGCRAVRERRPDDRGHRDSHSPNVKAEYLGFDYLKASVGTAEFGVPSGPAAVKVQAKAAPASVVAGGHVQIERACWAGGRAEAPRSDPTGEVTVTFGGTVQVLPLAAGKAVVELQTANLRPGAYRVHLAYSGNPTYQPHAANYQKLTVRKPHRRP